MDWGPPPPPSEAAADVPPPAALAALAARLEEALLVAPLCALRAGVAARPGVEGVAPLGDGTIDPGAVWLRAPPRTLDPSGRAPEPP